MSVLEVQEQQDYWVLWKDGARTSWLADLVCTCIAAKRQMSNKQCCKHIAQVIRSKADYVRPSQDHWIPMALPAPGVDGAASSVSWIRVRLIDDAVYVYLQDPAPYLVGAGGGCRLDVRAMIAPYLLSLTTMVTCRECGTSRRIREFEADPKVVILQVDAIREVCHWLENTNLNLCIDHDDSDLVPF